MCVCNTYIQQNSSATSGAISCHNPTMLHQTPSKNLSVGRLDQFHPSRNALSHHMNGKVFCNLLSNKSLMVILFGKTFFSTLWLFFAGATGVARSTIKMDQPFANTLIRFQNWNRNVKLASENSFRITSRSALYNLSKKCGLGKKRGSADSHNHQTQNQRTWNPPLNSKPQIAQKKLIAAHQLKWHPLLSLYLVSSFGKMTANALNGENAKKKSKGRFFIPLVS